MSADEGDGTPLRRVRENGPDPPTSLSQLHPMWVDESVRSRTGAPADASGGGGVPPPGCGQVVCMAYDLQAPSLYERLGYETVAVARTARPGVLRGGVANARDTALEAGCAERRIEFTRQG